MSHTFNTTWTYTVCSAGVFLLRFRMDPTGRARRARSPARPRSSDPALTYDRGSSGGPGGEAE